MNKNFTLRTAFVAVCITLANSSFALNLRDAVDSTIRTNPEVLVQSNEHLARLEELEQAKAGYKPTVDLSAGVGYERTDNNSTRARGYDWHSLTRKEAALNLRQMLFDGFATSSEVDRQTARIESQKLTVEGSSENLGLKAVDLYLQVLRHKDLMALSSENLEAHARVYDQVELRSNSGVGSSSDLAQIRGRRSSASANLLADDVNLRDAETNFLRVVGLLPEGLEQVAGAADKIPATQEEAIRIALENHPTLKSADADVAATVAQYKASKHAFYPRFDLELGARLGEDLDGTEGRDDDMTAMLRMRYNLFAGGKDQARTNQTARLINEAKEVRNNTYRQVVESMRLSWAAYEATKMQLTYLEDHVVASEKTRDAYSKQFNLGKRTLLDLLDNENELFEAKRSKSEAWYDHLLAQYRILAAMGMLKEHLGVELPELEDDEGRIHLAYADIADQSVVDGEVAPLKAILDQPVSLQQAPVSKTDDEAAVKSVMALIDSWKADWSGQNVDGYLSHYAGNFSPNKTKSRAAWASERQRIIKRPKWINLELNDVTVSVDGNRANVDFTQRYSSNTYSDVTKKRLGLISESGVWKIVEESNR